MKYTIEGFNQRNAIALGLNSEDLVLLRWFVDFKNTSDMKKKYIKQVNDMGYWVSYNYLIQELPILFSVHPKFSNSNYNELTTKDKIDIDKKYIKACKQKIKRIMSGNLSKVLLRNKSTQRDNEGKVKSEIYVHINPTVFKALISDDITEVQKCTTDTVVQKCTIDSSTNSLYSSTTQKKQKSKDFSSSKTNKDHENINLIEQETHLVINSSNKIGKVITWKYDRLKKAIDIFKKENGKYFTLLEKIYRDDKNFAPEGKGSKANKPLTRFHNITDRTKDYTPEELEKLLKENQSRKQAKRDTQEKVNQAVEVEPIEEIVESDSPKFVPKFKPTWFK